MRKPDRGRPGPLPLISVLLPGRIDHPAKPQHLCGSAFLAFGLAMGLVLQAFVNMAVAVGLVPVTGQTLPLVSMGGSSIFFTSMALGMILSVSWGTREEEEQANKESKEAKETGGNGSTDSGAEASEGEEGSSNQGSSATEDLAVEALNGVRRGMEKELEKEAMKSHG
ncbi:MAG: FtsW/RodA/SpoVE family cell cycle protein [Bacteroidales bacterium]